MPRRAVFVTVLVLGATAHACGGRTPLEVAPVASVLDAGDADAGMPDAGSPDAGGSSHPSRLAAGGDHSCTVAGDGRAWCWGSNVYAQVGDGATSDRASAVPVAGLGMATDVGAYDRFSCAIVEGGKVACWGYAVDQRLGSALADPDPPYGTSPVIVPEVTGALGLSRGSTAGHACALTSPWLYCWGKNQMSQLARRTSTPAEGPGIAMGSSDTIVAAGASTDTCIVNVRGYLACSGDAAGNGRDTPTVLLTTVSGVEDATAVGAGPGYGCVLLTSGSVGCWGSNASGQLGDGTTVSRADVRDVAGLSNVASLAVGADHTCALTHEGKVLCWGQNHFGQLGNGTQETATQPVPALIDDVVELAAGSTHTCARRASGALRCWGANANGQLGNGTRADSALPVDVLGLP